MHGEHVPHAAFQEICHWHAAVGCIQVAELLKCCACAGSHHITGIAHQRPRILDGCRPTSHPLLLPAMAMLPNALIIQNPQQAKANTAWWNMFTCSIPGPLPLVSHCYGWLTNGRVPAMMRVDKFPPHHDIAQQWQISFVALAATHSYFQS